ncbi:MAG: hypothetical protein Q9218_005837 [Villophora microphyllina]
MDLTILGTFPTPCPLSILHGNANLMSNSKQRDGVYAVTQVNVMPVGQPQTISFKGQATHGGGSCQVSLTTDTPPTKDSVFKVIKSIEGGCPSTNPGNVGTDPFGYGADKFQFSIPDSIPTGKNYTLAWTWFNKIGNREMYMNCAPITVPASSQRRSIDKLEERDSNAMSALPDMFRANIGSMGNGCSTAISGTVLAIPADNVGTNVQRIGTEALTPPIGNCGGTYGAARAAEPAAPIEPTTTAAPVQPTTSAALPPPVTSSSVPVADPVPTTTSVPASTTAAAPPANTDTAPATPPSIPGLTTGTCSTPGKSICSPDGTAWGTCDEHNSVIFQKIPDGTKCDPTLGTLVHMRRSRVFRAYQA